MSNERLVVGVVGILFVLMLLGTCMTDSEPPTNVTAEQLALVNTQVDALHEEILATRRPDTWLLLVFAGSILVPICLAVLLLLYAERGTLSRDEVFHVAVRHRLTPDMVNSALTLQELKKRPTLSDRLARQIRLVKRWREDRPALPSKSSKTPNDEEDPMNTIQAAVNPRLLTKANRLFTGSLEGRIIEILQNSRRAGATEVEIINADGHVIVRDNGRGVKDFTKLLDLGGSGWDDSLETSEDPAGVGLFCLAPREVVIRSNGKAATISGDGWTGAPVAVRDDPDPVSGTIVCFSDEPWDSGHVDINAVFCGMEVTVDGRTCPQLPFVSDQATAYPELGCRIEVRLSQDLSPWHHSCRREIGCYRNVVVNFHGQVVAFDFHPVSEHYLHFLVDLTSEPTDIRLMLPARTQLVENEAFDILKATLELEAYRYVQARGHHRLPHKEYLRARELGIELREAKPTFTVGLLSGDTPEPIEIAMPESFPLARCYRLDSNAENGDETDEANVHLLAALGTFSEPFVPVEIKPCYDGYGWAKLPTISRVELSVGQQLHDHWLWSGKLICVDHLVIAAHTSDGRVWTSPVCMAMRQAPPDRERTWCEEEVLVTPEAQEQLDPSDIWYHFGGWHDEGDTYDTQLEDFGKDLDWFWTQLLGPDEQLRRDLVRPLEGYKPGWQAVIITPDDKVTIRFQDGSERVIPPAGKSV